MRRRVACALLASSTDVLLPWAGTTRLRAIAGVVCASTCERVGVVVGAAAGRMTAALQGLPVATVPNVLWSEGTASAIRCAVAWALRSGADGLLLVDDQARLDRDHVETLLATFRATRTPVASEVAGELGLPAVFGIESFARLGHLTGERDAREVLCTTPTVEVVSWPLAEVPTAISERPTEPVVSAL
jgi:CTP:molybdopterin cytidylyltransferase MocA